MEFKKEINIDTDSHIYIDLKRKIKLLKINKKPLLIKVNSHPCAGKTSFIISNSKKYKGCNLYDFDKLHNENKTSKFLLTKNSNSILFGSSGGGLNRPYGTEVDYDIYDDVIYIFIMPKLSILKILIYNRYIRSKHGWRNPLDILKYRNNMYNIIINNDNQVKPLFYSFKKGLNFCINTYNES